MADGKLIGHTRHKVHNDAQTVVFGQLIYWQCVAQGIYILYSCAVGQIDVTTFLGTPLYASILHQKIHLIGTQHRKGYP